MQWTLLSVRILLLLPHGYEWVKVSSGTGLPGYSRTEGHEMAMCVLRVICYLFADEKSRVILTAENSASGSTYVNASTIVSHLPSHCYTVSQRF